MIPKRDKQAIGQRFLQSFREAGAVEVAPDILLPADRLLDLYGEDIRARAYVTTDPVRGEMMLRNDTCADAGAGGGAAVRALTLPPRPPS